MVSFLFSSSFSTSSSSTSLLSLLSSLLKDEINEVKANEIVLISFSNDNFNLIKNQIVSSNDSLNSFSSALLLHSSSDLKVFELKEGNKKLIWFVSSENWDLSKPQTIPSFNKKFFEIYLNLVNDKTKDQEIIFYNTTDYSEEKKVEENKFFNSFYYSLILLHLLTFPGIFYSSSILFSDFLIENSQKLTVQFSQNLSNPDQEQFPDGNELKKRIEKLLKDLVESQDFFKNNLNTSIIFVLEKLVYSIVKNRKKPQGLLNMRAQILSVLQNEEDKFNYENSIKRRKLNEDLQGESDQILHGVKEIDPINGIKVLEFFSGIGGMRMALPDEIEGVPITSIHAFDCSSVPNKVYEHNFHGSGSLSSHPKSVKDSKLSSIMIEGLRLEDLDGAADVWTMSPPCQPYTTTRGARRLDHVDNRSRALYHLVNMLYRMKHLPRYILVENVKGFIGSNMHSLWRRVMKICGYEWEEYMLSPDKTIGLPNARNRYYFLGRHSKINKSPTFGKTFRNEIAKDEQIDQELENIETNQIYSKENIDGKDNDENSDDEKEELNFNDENFEEILKEYNIFTTIPDEISEKYSSFQDKENKIPITVGELISNIKNKDIINQNIEDLIISKKLLSSSWSKEMISLVQLSDTLTFCFTKGYGRRCDHSTGSLFLNEQSYLSKEQENANTDGNENLLINKKDNKSLLYGHIRYFHPEELLLLFGYPVALIDPNQLKLVKAQDFSSQCIASYSFPSNLTLLQKYACIGNSVNVQVIRSVMDRLFNS